MVIKMTQCKKSLKSVSKKEKKKKKRRNMFICKSGLTMLLVTIWRYRSTTQYNWNECNCMSGGQRIKTFDLKRYSVTHIVTYSLFSISEMKRLIPPYIFTQSTEMESKGPSSTSSSLSKDLY